MKPFILAVVATLALGANSGLAQEHPDFSGVWIMDGTRSGSATQSVPIREMAVAIQQTPTEVRIATTTAKGVDTIVYRSNAAAPVDKASQQATFRWEERTLFTTHQTEINKSTVTISEARTLNANGSEMIVKRSLVVQHGYEGISGRDTTPNVATQTDVFLKR